ncbi:MAG: RNA polymerase sigma factor [Thermoanaerobaculia bacterium]
MSARSQTTHWSLVLAARGGATESSRDALTRLCELYWYPIYVFVRRRGHSAEDARDLTQGYFARLLEKGYLDDVPPEAARFRSFLFASVSRFLSNARDRAGPARSGGGRTPISLDTESAEQRYRIEPADNLTPEKVFEKQWALALLDRALGRLQEEHPAGQAAARFQRLRPYLSGEEPGAAQREIAEELGMTEGALRQAIDRLRKRFGEVLREEIRQTVAEPDAVDGELRHLLSSLSE